MTIIAAFVLTPRRAHWGAFRRILWEYHNMSLQAIASVAYERRSQADLKLPSGRRGLEGVQVDGDGQSQQPVMLTAKQFNSALETLKHYIPTEFLALYLPFLAIAKDRGKDATDVSLWLYIGFLIATPIAVFLIYLAKAAENGTAGAWKKPPIFEAVLASIAFAVWGAAVPGMFPGHQWWIALLAMGSAFVLPLLDRIFGKKPANV